MLDIGCEWLILGYGGRMCGCRLFRGGADCSGGGFFLLEKKWMKEEGKKKKGGRLN